MKKVVLGLSGGFDSAVAALLLRREGDEVAGMWLDLGLGGRDAAETAARQLGIPFIAFAAEDRHVRLVRRPFAAAYASGVTPNPCVVCNRLVKFAALIETADSLGAGYIATGHYAGVDSSGGRFRILESGGAKDQSYMLCALGQDTLSRLVFPLFGRDKSDIRRIAAEAGVSAASAKDSMDVCFIPDGDHAAYLERLGFALPPGDFVDADGNVLGRHEGAHRYTVGQRRGLGVAAGKRIYVSRINLEKNEVELSDIDGLSVGEIRAKDVNWVSLAPTGRPFRAEVKLRHGSRRFPALISPEGGGLRIVFDSPVKKPAAGQFAVGYDGRALLFGAEIVP
ncbi:MAG: tRNA 2-thiouridine(34) synthase MnmA [Oscillospiraceae bacterium]|nr:tRNA 2-thiouridine(34) synthase MnmA [Oscillospiraceae bacterium]